MKHTLVNATDTNYLENLHNSTKKEADTTIAQLKILIELNKNNISIVKILTNTLHDLAGLYDIYVK